MLKLGSLFDGIGVFPLAAAKHGIRPLWASEIEKAPISITKRHFPYMEHVGDVTLLHGGQLPPVDILTFGSPCQNLSQIGNRDGLAGEQSGLFYEAIRIINEMRCATDGQYPQLAIWENVAGAFSSGLGEDFRAVLAAFTNREIPMPDNGKWANAGMVPDGCPCITWRLLDSQHFKSAQSRERVFLVADYRAQRAPEILFNPLPLHKILGDGEESGLPLPGECGSGASEAGRHYTEVRCFHTRKMRGAVQYHDPKMFLSAIGKPGTPCPTLLTGDYQVIAVHFPDAPEKDYIRKLTVTEFEVLMGLPVGWTEFGHEGQRISDSARFKALGNSIVLGCAEYVMAGVAAHL
ncbi:DNA cytosine methyltransferase [Christensenellaceae bacterium OttesenSCG-928-L17]|nr:DNA cytosine methyltransferase [Christensenellaceae bacterium OttesenSCG-928-L17]